MRRLRILASLAALAAGCAPVAGAGTSFHVDYAEGRDSADGRTPATAWKHAPGDPEAGGAAAAVKLQPGDRVLFRAGVPYRGSIQLNASGTAEKPIVYTGIGWGEGLGVIDGADPVTVARPCRDAADCGGAGEWRQLTRIEYAMPKTSRIVLYGAKGLYWLSQLPKLDDPFYSDERKLFAPVAKGQLADLKRGVLRSPELARLARSGGQMELAFWVVPNLVSRAPVTGVDGERILFNPDGIRFYEDRDNAVALNGSFEGLREAGRYVVLRPGVLVARLRPEDSGATLAVGNGRSGINLGGQSNVTVTGLHFRNMTGAMRRLGEGLAIVTGARMSSNIEISGNRFGPAFLEHRRGIVSVRRAEDLRFLVNRIEDVAFGKGLGTNGLEATRLLIAGNVIRRVGESGIMLLGTRDAVIRGNILADIRGVHANGIAVYLSNRNTLVEGNCVVFSKRPLTFEGNGKDDGPNNIVIRQNILISSPDGQAAINSWGRKTRVARIEGNLLVGPRAGLSLAASDRGVVVEGNDTSGIAGLDRASADTVLRDNRDGLTLAGMAGGQFSEEGCGVPGTRIPPVTRARFDLGVQPQ